MKKKELKVNLMKMLKIELFILELEREVVGMGGKGIVKSIVREIVRRERMVIK